MDPARTQLGRMLLEEITPVVMVLSTPHAEAACLRNGLGIVDLLAPFSLFTNIDVPVRTASDQPYRLQMFRVRLVNASDVRKQSFQEAQERLTRVVSESNEMEREDLLSDPPQLEAVLKKSEMELWPSWIRNFNKELVKSISFSEHETFDHPVACVVVASSKDERPLGNFVDLFNTNQLPFLVHDGSMDPKILKQYLLLHDNQDSSPDKAASIFADMRNAFGAADCKLLRINSSIDGVNIKNSPSFPYKISSDRCYLTFDDVNEIRDFMQDLVANHIIPYMEQKIRVLNQQVSATRKGFRNQIKNLWGRKGKEDVPDGPAGPTYTYSSIESQIRLLGDFAFTLRDYELALSNYRLLSTDYRLDKAWKRYAGVQEMSGLAYFMLDQWRKESENCMETAFSTYLKIGSSGQRNATRCGLWWAEMLKARGNYLEASSVYFRLSNEEPSLSAAVMLEQASCCYLLSRPPLFRKYGYHLLLAGNRYYTSDQKQHAIRAFKNALFVYKENPWRYINDHVHFNLGRWYGVLGIFDLAIKHLLEVLECSHQSLTTQTVFVNEFFQFVQKMGKRFDVHKLQLPVVNTSSVKVLHEDHRTYASNAAVEVNESRWQELEEEMIPQSAAVRANWLDSQLKPFQSSKRNEAGVCVVGESVKVSIELKNPLQLSVSVSGISLICELSVRSEASASDEGMLSLDTGDDIKSANPVPSRLENEESDLFTLTKLDTAFMGGESKIVHLEVTPKVVGVLTIIGIRWMLSDFVMGYQYFEPDKSKKKRNSRNGVSHSLSTNMTLLVIEGLPKLEGSIDSLPVKAFADDIRPLTLNLKNSSSHLVKRIKLKISHPRYLVPGSPEDLEKKFPLSLAKHSVSNKNEAHGDTTKSFRSFLFEFPQDVTISEGSISWPLWLHCSSIGTISLLLSIYYEIGSSSSTIAYRTLRMHHKLEVVPSLDISFVISPSSRLQEYLVRMEIVNRTLFESFRLHQLSCTDSNWVVAPLRSCTSICSVESILTNQTLSCFFKLKNVHAVTSEHVDATPGSSDVLIDLQSNDADMIEVSRSPLADIHAQERHHQRKLSKDNRGRLDFILISKLDTSFNPENGPTSRIFSHHICYCSAVRNDPIWWFMEGPRCITHNFSNSFYCEAAVDIVIRNCSGNPASIRVATFDRAPVLNDSADSSPNESPGQGGWSAISLTNDAKLIAGDQASPPQRAAAAESVPPFLWCSATSTRVDVEPGCTVKVPLQLCIFAPGVYDLSCYELQWKLLSSSGEQSSTGVGLGHPFFLTVLGSS